jgi:hypothetical protein
MHIRCLGVAVWCLDMLDYAVVDIAQPSRSYIKTNNLVDTAGTGMKDVVGSNNTYSYAKVPNNETVWVWKTAGIVPPQLKMDTSTSYGVLSTFSDIQVHQTKRSWFQEMMGCEAVTEFRVNSIKTHKDDDDVLYARENSPFFMRMFCARLHPWDMTLWRGADDSGDAVATYHRPLRTPLSPLKCCCYQQVHHADADGETIGDTIEDFYVCVPRFRVDDPKGNTEYIISSPTCMGGACVDYFAEGIFSCRIPFYVFPVGADPVAGEEVGKIVKVWGGIATEFLTDADTFELQFPRGCTAVNKTRLLGSVFLLNQLFFEGRNKR